MPATSKSQQRLMGMVHAYQKGRLRKASKRIREIAAHISEEDAEHFAKTRHDGLPEKKKKSDGEEEKKAFDLSFVMDRLEKLASGRKGESYFEGEGEVESFTPSKTEGHDEIVFRDRDGNRYRISNNTKIGKVLNARIGDRIRAHGYRVDGTNVVHKVHMNVHGRGGWLERLGPKDDDRDGVKKAAATKVIVYVGDQPNEFDSINEAAVFIAGQTSSSRNGVVMPSDPISVNRVKTMLGERQRKINGLDVEYPQPDGGSGMADLASVFRSLTGSYGSSSYGMG